MLHCHKKDILIFLPLLYFIHGRNLKLSDESDFMEFLEEKSLNLFDFSTLTIFFTRVRI